MSGLDNGAGVRPQRSLPPGLCHAASALREVADWIGPTVAEVDVPLSPAETPRYPDETICFTFDPNPVRRLDDD